MANKAVSHLHVFMTKYEDKVHLALAGIWLLMMIPTILFWSNSVVVVLIYSVYALVGAHIAAYEAAKDDSQIDLLIEEVRELRKQLEDK